MNPILKRILWGKAVGTEGLSAATTYRLWRIIRPLLILWVAVAAVVYPVYIIHWLLSGEWGF
jgi:hypothetical protein